MEHILEGARVVLSDRRLWKYVWGPLLLSALVFVGVAVGGYFLIVPWLEGAVSRLSISRGAASTVASGVYAIAWIFLAGPVFVSIAAGMSSLLWDRLSVAVEERLLGEAVRNEPPTAVVIRDSIMRTVFSISLSLFGLCCAWVLPFLGAVLLAGLISLLDFTASAFVRRGITLRPQLSKVFRLRGWPTFMLGAGFLTLLPLINVLLLPLLVAGGTVMVVKGRSVEALGR